MSTGKKSVPARVRQRVGEEARHRCGYCLRTEELMGMTMTLDHIIPEAAGGPSSEENLWLACRRCNEFKGTQTHARDPLTGKQVRLFSPRQQKWGDHFTWSEDGTEIQGLTPCGRATVTALKLNNPEIVIARRLWVSAGWWPPED
jgi:hypothetical protein